MNSYLLAFLIVMLAIVVCLLLLGLIFWSILRQKNRRRNVPRRVSSTRAEPIDLAAERMSYLSVRHRREEAAELRRVA